MPKPPLMLFAAGLGRRMAPLTDHLPKPLIPVAGRALIDHALDLAREAGIDRIVVNSHYLPDMLAAHLAPRGITPVYEPELLETGGGLKNALPLLGSEVVLTLNSDAVWTGENPLQSLLSAWDPDRMQALLLLADPCRALGHVGGDFLIGADGRLTRGPGPIYAGAQILHTARLAAEPAAVFSMNRIWDAMIADDGLFGVVHPGRWCDVGRPEGIALAEGMLADV